ncbi:hypothetical protein [Cupriavidus sp. amp6]|nr:hypothetical protein [Cupriavidus sp. amp6]
MIDKPCSTSATIDSQTSFDVEDFVFEVEWDSGHDPERAMWGEAIQ